MNDFAWEIAAAVRSLPPEFDVKLVLAHSDEFYTNADLNTAEAVGPDEISLAIPRAPKAGGADNVPALLEAWDLAVAKPGNNAIVWVHSPQLLQLSSVEELRQRWERRFGPALYSVRTTSGTDEVEKRLDGINEVKSVVRKGDLQSDLTTLFAQLTGKAKTFEFVRTSKKLDEQLDLTGAVETSDHLARLWANEEVARILSARDETLNDAAMQLAVRYQLVTPVSGAVVLENAEQYRAAGLTPVDAGTVPTIPEPEVVAFLAVAGIVLCWVFYRKYCPRGRSRCTL